MRKYAVVIAELILTLCMLFLILYYLFNWIMNSVIHVKEEVFVPDIQGLPLIKAVDILSDKDLSLKKMGDEFNRDLPAGTVVRQNPGPGTVVRVNRAVKVVISIGGEIIKVPDLVGKTLRSSEIELRQFNLALGEISTRYSLRYKKDIVISSDPQPGSIAEKDSMINVVVSDGAPPEDIVLMPYFVNSSIENAEQWADGNDIRISAIIQDQESIAPEGMIIAQEPEPDEVITSKTKIFLTVGTSADADFSSGGKIFEYPIPQGSGAREVKIVLETEISEKILFQSEQKPGTKVKIPYPTAENAKIKVYINGILVSEQQI